MSRFTVRIEASVYPKGNETQTLDEEYLDWKDADTAFCAYQSLTKLDKSRIHHVELIEHREEKIHKAASKGDDTNVLLFGGARHVVNG